MYVVLVVFGNDRIWYSSNTMQHTSGANARRAADVSSAGTRRIEPSRILDRDRRAFRVDGLRFALNPHLSTLNPQLSALNPQPSTLNSQLSPLASQASTLNPQLPTLNPQPPTLNPQILNPEHSTHNPQPSTLNLKS